MINGKGCTVLLVEDEMITAMHEKLVLEKYNYNVLIAKNGEQSIELVNKNQSIDLILMDINLGNGIDGTKAAEKILKEHDIPLIFLSSHTEPEIVEKTEGITSYGYIVKNTGETVLIASIRMAFRLFEARQMEQAKENALIESERKLNTLISNLPGFIYRCLNDSNWTMEYISEGCIKITGYTPDDFLYNKKLAFNDIILSDYRQLLWDKWQQVLVNKEVFEEEYQIKTATGEIRWVWERGRGIYSESGELKHLEGFVQDITDKKF